MDEFERLARELSEATDEDDRLRLAVQVVIDLLDGCDRAGVTIAQGGHYQTKGASDDLVVRGDVLQYELNEGPCIDSVRDQETVISHDLLADSRWPRWAPAVHEEIGTRSMLSLLLYTGDASYGALNLYGSRPRAFDPDDLATARAVAGHLAVAMSAGREIQHLGVAIHNRTVIGQAEGIIMERLGIDAEQAFAYLRRVSQHHNRKLVQIAADIVETRHLPTRQ